MVIVRIRALLGEILQHRHSMEVALVSNNDDLVSLKNSIRIGDIAPQFNPQGQDALSYSLRCFDLCANKRALPNLPAV